MRRQRLTPRSGVQLDHARELRRRMSPPQARLWSRLRGDQLGFRFRREHRIGPSIADIACPALMLVIEVDGDSHVEREKLRFGSNEEAGKHGIQRGSFYEHGSKRESGERC